MRRYTILTIAIIFMMTLTSVASYCQPVDPQPSTAKPTTIVIDGKEYTVDAITENGQLFISIEDLAPAVGLQVDPSKKSLPTLNTVAKTNSNIAQAKLSFNIDLISNNSVGDEWFYYIKTNKNTYNSSDQNAIIELDGDNIPVELVVYEHDASKSDYGSSSFVIPYSEIIKGDVLTYTRTITVTENGGRYSGNTATIQFNLTITPM